MPGLCPTPRSITARTATTGPSGFRRTSSPSRFPGQFRNWFYVLLTMSTVLEHEPPFQTVLGHAQVRDGEGREMHKSWGNAIEFNEAADRAGASVMRWMYMGTNPEHNVNFGWNTLAEVERRLLTLWNVYAFFVTYAELEGFDPVAGGVREGDSRLRGE